MLLDKEDLATKDPLEILHECGGYYECPRDSNGNRIAPLVGYAGTYTADDGKVKNYVGDKYYNFAMAEQYPKVYSAYALRLCVKVGISNSIDLTMASVMLGAPMGGILFAGALAQSWGTRVIFCEKKIRALATADKREDSELVLGRHEVRKDDNVIIVEDVCNNFSTTEKVIELIEHSGATAIAVTCILNRAVEENYERKNGQKIPVVSLVHSPTRQYKQEDPEVCEHIRKGNLVLKPKNEW